jgi:hypothetical protein
MSITDPGQSTTTRASSSATAPGDGIRRDASRPARRETKPSPKTTELWLAIVGVAVLAVIYNASRDVSLDLFRACLLGTIMASAYIVSRGFAKAGSRDDDDRADEYDYRT